MDQGWLKALAASTLHRGKLIPPMQPDGDWAISQVRAAFTRLERMAFESAEFYNLHTEATPIKWLKLTGESARTEAGFALFKGPAQACLQLAASGIAYDVSLTGYTGRRALRKGSALPSLDSLGSVLWELDKKILSDEMLLKVVFQDLVRTEGVRDGA